ncbi:MAG: DinB family protein [Thermomicrobiales bacterium]|nr:DinB family protein [Thermomicrobiales bacterium]
MRVSIERGPKGKKCVAYAIDWPGLERNGKTVDTACERLDEYRQRYARVATLAGLGQTFTAEPAAEIIEDYPGVGSTDFWGISFAQSPLDLAGIDTETFERRILLLEACWQEFDDIATRVSPELRKGPRGGGRDRDHIVRHLIASELDWTPKIGIRLDYHDVAFPVENRQQFHEEVVAQLRYHYTTATPARLKGGPEWSMPFFIRHLAYHVMDHAWEMEDKDLGEQDSTS